MTDMPTLHEFGLVTEPATLTIERLLPGPIDRVWAYITDGELRRQWLAAGTMDTRVGGQVEFVWRNSELTNPPGKRPEGFAEEHRMVSEITECEPPNKLSITWGSTGGVTFTLEQRANAVLLKIVHRRVTDPIILLRVSAGWHAHLDILAARLMAGRPAPFWDNWRRLQGEYEKRLNL